MYTISDVATALQNIAQQLGQLVRQQRQDPVPTYPFASLPSASGSPGLVVYVSDGREPGQLAGTGTGMLAFSNGTGWRSTAGGALLN